MCFDIEKHNGQKRGTGRPHCTTQETGFLLTIWSWPRALANIEYRRDEYAKHLQWIFEHTDIDWSLSFLSEPKIILQTQEFSPRRQVIADPRINEKIVEAGLRVAFAPVLVVHEETRGHARLDRIVGEVRAAAQRLHELGRKALFCRVKRIVQLFDLRPVGSELQEPKLVNLSRCLGDRSGPVAVRFDFAAQFDVRQA